MSKKEPKAIVIDDNEHVLSVVAAYLKLNGFSVKAFGCSLILESLRNQSS